MLDMGSVLRDDQIFLQRWDGAIVLCLLPTDICFRAFGQHFNQDGGVHKRILPSVGKLGVSADDGQIRVGIQVHRFDFQTKITGI